MIDCGLFRLVRCPQFSSPCIHGWRSRHEVHEHSILDSKFWSVSGDIDPLSGLPSSSLVIGVYAMSVPKGVRCRRMPIIGDLRSVHQLADETAKGLVTNGKRKTAIFVTPQKHFLAIRLDIEGELNQWLVSKHRRPLLNRGEETDLLLALVMGTSTVGPCK